MTDKTYQWISIKEQMPALDTVCFLSFGHWVGFGARIIINADVDPRSVADLKNIKYILDIDDRRYGDENGNNKLLQANRKAVFKDAIW